MDETPKNSGFHPIVEHRYHRYEDEDLITEVNEKLTPEPILDVEDKIGGVFKDGSTLGTLKPIGKDIERDVDTLVEDIYPEAKKDLK